MFQMKLARLLVFVFYESRPALAVG